MRVSFIHAQFELRLSHVRRNSKQKVNMQTWSSDERFGLGF